MAVKVYDRKDRNKQFGVKWGHWKNPKFKFFARKAERDEYMTLLIKREKEQGEAALNISNLEAHIMQKCISLTGSAETVLRLYEAHAGELTTLKNKTLLDAIEEYLTEKYNLGRDENYYRNIKNILLRMECALNCKAPTEIKYNDAKNWRFSLGYAPIPVHFNARDFPLMFEATETAEVSLIDEATNCGGFKP